MGWPPFEWGRGTKMWMRYERLIRRAAGMVAACTLAGALAGAVVEVIHDALPGGLPFASLVDVWPPVLAIVGFLGAAIAAVLGIGTGLRTR